MRYTVLWTRLAEDDLTSIWLDAEDRAVVSEAANQIDRNLSLDAHDRGESREGNCRILFVPPLGAEFELNPLDRTVRVVAVWWCPLRRN